MPRPRRTPASFASFAATTLTPWAASSFSFHGWPTSGGALAAISTVPGARLRCTNTGLFRYCVSETESVPRIIRDAKVHQCDCISSFARQRNAPGSSARAPGYLPRSFAAALRTPSTLTCPVALRIVSRRAFGENCGTGLGRFLFSVSPRFS